MNDKALSQSIPLHKVASAPARGVKDEEEDETWPLRRGPPSSRRGSSTISTTSRWSETIRKVLGGIDDKKKDEDDAEPDLLGEHITRIINSSPAFKRPAHRDIQEDECDDDNVRPLLSSHNIRQVYRWLIRLRPRHLVAMVQSVCNSCSSLWNVVSQHKVSLMRAGRLFALLWIGSLFLFVTVIYMTITFILRNTVLYGKLFISLLLDVNELKSSCPSRLKTLWNNLVQICVWIDDYVLFRRKIAGREWNDDEFVWRDNMSAKSRRETLWKCPPPSCEKVTGPPPNTNAPQHDRSVDTVNHICAVEFCYDVLRKEHLRKQHAHRRKLMKRSASCRVGDRPKLMDKRTELAGFNKQSSDHSISFSRAGVSGLSPIQQGPEDHDFFSDDEPKLKTPISGSMDHKEMNLAHRSHPSSGLQPSSNTSSPLRIRSYSDSDVGSSSYRDTDAENTDESSLDSSSRDVRFSNDRPTERSTHSDAGQDMNWLDVGTRIGIRLLNSEHVQKAIASQDTAERIMDISNKMAAPGDTDGMMAGSDSFLDFNMDSFASIGGPLVDRYTGGVVENKTVVRTPQRPVHSMWTSPGAAASSTGVSVSSISDVEDSSVVSDIPSPPMRQRKRIVVEENTMFPLPTSGTPTSKREKRKFRRRSYSLDHPAPLPKERRDETEIYFNSQVSSKQDSPRITESVETSLARKKVATCPKLARPSATRQITQRSTLTPGVKVVVPIFPLQPNFYATKRTQRPDTQFQMATVVSSKRIYVKDALHPRKYGDHKRYTNCLSVTVALDKSFLRNGGFANMTFRVMNEWSSRYMPKHSKFPIGACVATSFGLGVLVSWRVEDDCHVVRSLWQHKGKGRAHAYLNRDAIHRVVEAAVGFDVETKLGRGTVLAYVNGGKNFRTGRYFVLLKEETRHKGSVLEFNRTDILSCESAEFTPVIEYIREAAQYQIQLENYEAAVKMHKLELSDKETKEEKLFREWSKGFETIWSSFLKAIEEDSEFDVGMSEFMSSMINFLERLDKKDTRSEVGKSSSGANAQTSTEEGGEVSFDRQNLQSINLSSDEDQANGFWILDSMFGGVFKPGKKGAAEASSEVEIVCSTSEAGASNSQVLERTRSELSSTSFQRAYAVLRVMMRTVAIARASCGGRANFRLALSICYEFLLFVRTVIKVQEKNVSPDSIAVWRRAFDEIVETFGPVKERLAKIGRGIAERVERQGNRAKVRILRFVDIVLVDEQLLAALEVGEWERVMMRLERALVKARVIEPDSREHYRKCLVFIYDHMAPAPTNDSAAARNSEKLAHFAKALKWLASPRRSLLSLLKHDDVLEFFERIFVRVFRKDEVASRMLRIHASNFNTFRHLRMLKDFSISGKLWLPLLDAADEEFSWAGSRMPETTKDFMEPLAKLFSLGVTQFHKLYAGELTTDWLDFLMEEEAVKLIHEMDMKLILGLESFCHDVKEVMVVLPYYPSIDDDILNLMDEVDFEEFVKEASEAIADPDGPAAFLKEKATIAIERFLDYLPKMSIPVERRDIGDGWVITCRGEDGGDLKLSDVSMKRENMVCQILGSENVFFPKFGDDCSEVSSVGSSAFESVAPHPFSGTGRDESSVLDHIRELILNAQLHGSWKVGVGGVGRPPSDPHVRTVLQGLPVSSVLNCGIELWRNLEIDDDELLEIAVRDVSFQIQLQKEREQRSGATTLAHLERHSPSLDFLTAPSEASVPKQKGGNPLQFPFGRFNPRRDPTILYLEMNKLSLNLEKFMFSIEKGERKTIFDPVFDGYGSLSVKNVSIKLRVECRKERADKLGINRAVPVLFLQELEVKLAKVKFKVKETGADWILNKVVDGFSENISRVVEANLKEQVSEQLASALQNLNSYFEVNPDLMMSLLGITMDDLEEGVVWV